MVLDMCLTGSKWIGPDDDEKLDGFKITRVELLLAEWHDDERLYQYMNNLFGEFLLPGQRLYEADLDKIINTLSVCPSVVYGEDKEQAAKDLITFSIVRDWLKKNIPHGSVQFDVTYTGV
jgi:hypothetical protein